MKYSIIIPTFNNLNFSFQCIQSVLLYTRNFELILVDNGSTDGSIEYFSSLEKSHANIHLIALPENLGFGPACNKGFEISTGDYIVFLNNDAIVTPDWADQLISAIPLCEKEFDVSPVAFVGPRTNNAGGNQAIETDPYNIDQLPEASILHHKEHKGKTQLAGFLSGFCLLCKRTALEKIGLFDERFKVGGFEDNDLILRAQLAGYKCCIDDSTFVHHFGQQTLKLFQDTYDFTLRSNQLKFIEKYYSDSPKKLVGLFRVHNQPELLKKSLARASMFCDDIVVLLHNCTDNTEEVARSFPLVSEIVPVNGPWDFFRDCSMLMDAAKKHKADWIIVIDADEIPEDSFTREYVEKLMNPINPETFAYGINFNTFFLGNTHYRIDGTFGTMWGIRMWRVLPESHPRRIRGKDYCALQCPSFAPFNVVHLRIRFKHYGYNSPDVCSTKYDFYTRLDPNPDPGYISPIGYNHLISPSFILNEYKEKNDLTLCMTVKNEELNLFSFLYRYSAHFDEIVIIDSGSSDRTVHIAEAFGAKVFHHKFENDFSKLRNFAMSKCTGAWIMFMDPDEEIATSDFPILFKLLDESLDAYIFQFANYMPDGSICYSDNVRLFRNIPEIYWSFRVHETVSESIRKSKLKVVPCPFKLKHFGFLKGDHSKASKMKSYGHMLRHQIRELPSQPLGYFHYAFHLFEEGKEEKGIRYLKKSLKLDPGFFLSSKELGLRHLIKASEYIKKSSSDIPEGHYFHRFLSHLSSEIDKLLSLNPDRV